MNVKNLFREKVMLGSSSVARPRRSEAELERPYFDRLPARLPALPIFMEVYRREGIEDPKTLVEAGILKSVNNHRKIIDGLQAEYKIAFHNGDLNAARAAAKKRLKAGKGTAADGAFDSGSWRLAKRKLKGSIRAEIEKAAPDLVLVAQQVQAVFRRVLPTLEAEAERLHIEPHTIPLIQEVARGCWAPAVVAAHGDSHPRVFLKQLGIKL